MHFHIKFAIIISTVGFFIDKGHLISLYAKFRAKKM